jgi:hypothetical protein
MPVLVILEVEGAGFIERVGFPPIKTVPGQGTPSCLRTGTKRHRPSILIYFWLALAMLYYSFLLFTEN